MNEGRHQTRAGRDKQRRASQTTYARRRAEVAAVEEQTARDAAAPQAPWLAGDTSALPKRPPGAA